MIRNFAALISLTVVFSGSVALSTQPVEAKTSRSNSARPGNYFVPPPPPYTPSMVPSELGNAQALTANADNAVGEKPVKPNSKHILTLDQGDMPQVVQPNPQIGFDPVVETRILKHIDDIDSEIAGVQKEIGKLLNL